MATGAVGLPPGFTLDPEPSSTGLPPGFTLDQPASAVPPPWVPYAQQTAQYDPVSGFYKLRKDGSKMTVSPSADDLTAAGKSVATWAGAPAALDQGVRSIANGATFGQADKAQALMDSFLGPKSYDEALADQKAKTNAIPENERHVLGALGLIASPANRVIGAMVGKALPITKGGSVLDMVKNYLNYGTQGGITNALYQATIGRDEKAAQQSAAMAGGAGIVGMVAPPEGGGPIPEIAKDFAKGVPLGIAGPLAVEGGPAALKALASPILNRLNPEEAFWAGLGRAADRSGLTPDMLAAKNAKLGDAGMLSNIGGQITDYARDIAQFPGRARQMAQTAFGRQSGSTVATTGGAVGRLENAIDDGLSSENARDTVKALTDLRTKTSSPLWEQLPMEDAPQSKVFDVLATNPEVKKGMRIGAAKARNFANANGETFDPSTYVKEGANGEAMPTFGAWQGAKEGLDDILFSGGKHIVDPMTGKLTGYGNSVAQLRGTLLDEMKLHMPGYEDALNTWSGPTQAMRMVDLGQKIAKGDARVTGDLMSAMTPNEQDFLRIGYADQMKYLATKTKDGANVVKSLFGDQNARRNAEMLFRTRDDFNQFRINLAQEAKFHNSKQTILGGSPTAPRLAGMQDATQDIGQAMVEGGKNGGAVGAAAGALSKGWRYLKAEPEAVRDFGAQYLFSTDPAKRAEAINQLRRMFDNGGTYGTMPADAARAVTAFGVPRL